MRPRFETTRHMVGVLGADMVKVFGFVLIVWIPIRMVFVVIAKKEAGGLTVVRVCLRIINMVQTLVNIIIALTHDFPHQIDFRLSST